VNAKEKDDGRLNMNVPGSAANSALGIEVAISTAGKKEIDRLHGHPEAGPLWVNFLRDTMRRGLTVSIVIVLRVMEHDLLSKTSRYIPN